MTTRRDLVKLAAALGLAGAVPAGAEVAGAVPAAPTIPMARLPIQIDGETGERMGVYIDTTSPLGLAGFGIYVVRRQPSGEVTFDLLSAGETDGGHASS